MSVFGYSFLGERFTIVVLVLLLCLSAVLAWRLRQTNARIRAKNRALKENLCELLRYKELAERQVAAEEEGMPAPADETALAAEPDYDLYVRLVRYIKENRLFLRPDITRDEILKVVSVPRAKFGQLFKKYNGTNFSRFLNDLRIEHAASLLVQHPEWTIEVVAIESGMGSLPSFYRAFTDRYGITPAEFRKGEQE